MESGELEPDVVLEGVRHPGDAAQPPPKKPALKAPKRPQLATSSEVERLGKRKKPE